MLPRPTRNIQQRRRAGSVRLDQRVDALGLGLVVLERVNGVVNRGGLAEHHSCVGRRPIRPAASSWIGVPASTAQTPSVIGISIPKRCDRSRNTGAVVSPSTTW